MLLHAALNVAFYRATGAADQPVGVLASTRELTGDAARLALGLFINAVVVRTRLAGKDSPATVLAAVRDGALAAYAHADTPFSDVVAALRLPRPAIGNPLFQVMFNYMRPASAAGRDWAGLALSEFNDVRHRVVFELELDIVEHSDGRVTGAFSYANELVDGTFVEALATDYLAVVGQFVDAPHAALGMVEPHFTDIAPPDLAAPKIDEINELHTEASHFSGALQAIWSGLFDGNAPPRDANLLEAGATSFDIVRFVDAARAAGYMLAIVEVFATPYFSVLGKRLAAQSPIATALRDAG
jgi:non-ribosomal peptide synthetase component F